MRGLRSFLALLVIALGLGAYLYFVESKRTPGDDEEKRDKVFAVEADKIEEVTIKAESGDRTTVRKSGEAWQVAEPVGAPADAAEMSGITSNLSTLEIQRVIDEQAADLKEYGLQDPRIQVTYKAGGESRTLSIGSKTPPGSDLYARVGDETRVFLIPSHLESTFNRGTFDLRDKTVLKVEADKVDSLEIVAGKGSVHLTKKDAEWQMTQPVTAAADFSAVSGVISRLTSAQMKAVEPGGAGDLKKYGLDAPAATVRVGTGSSRAVLHLGSAAAEGTVYAKDESRPDIFTVEASLLDELKKPAGDYRQKDLFDARAFNTTRIEVTRGGQTVAYERANVKDKDGKEEEKWRQVAPAAKDVDGATVDSFLSAVTSARADSFVDDAAKVAKPEITVLLKFDEGKKEDRVVFARDGSDSYASRAGMPGAARIDAASYDAILKALEGIK